MLENTPIGLDRGEIECVVGNQYNRRLRQQHDSKAISASQDTTTADRGQEKNRRPIYQFQGKCLNCGKKGHRAGECRGVRKIENPEIPQPTKRAEVGARATSAGVKNTLRISPVACAKSFSTGLTIVRSEELKKARCWQN